MMEKGKLKSKLRTLVLAMLLLLAVSPVTAMAANNKTGLVKEKGNYYFYNSKGKKIKNKWKTVKGYTYYFGKIGAAYKAPATYDKTYNFKLFKIGSKKYGFDSKARRVSGVLVSQSGKLYYFSKKGVYIAQKTKNLRKVVKKGIRPSNLISLIRSKLGKPKKIKWSETGSSCDGWNETDLYTDVSMFYPHFEIVMVRNDTTGEMKLSYCMPTK